MPRADLDAPLYAEPQIFRQLREAGWQGNTQQLRQLAHKGESLRRRWEAECSYAWAGNSESYKARTEALENEVVGMAARFGLACYLQTDCRGVPVYVAMQPLDDLTYNRDGQPLYWNS